MSRRRKYKVGIIGCGMIFPRHVESILTNKDAYELVAVCDIDQVKVDLFSKEHQVPGFTDYRDMLIKMKGKMNLVVIATPNALHLPQALHALRAGYDVIIEKPVAFDYVDIEKIAATARKHKRKAYGVLQVRYNHILQLLKEALVNGVLGNIRSVSLIQRWQRPPHYFQSWRADVGVGGRTLYEVGIHYMDIMQNFFGVPEVLGTGTFSNKHKNVSFEDTVFSILRFPGNVSGSLEVTIAAEPQNLECSLAILGSIGHIKVGGKALNKIEEALFENVEYEKRWKDLVDNFGSGLAPNKYGDYQGSSPNHPTLYKEIALGRGLDITETVGAIKFIQRVYDMEVK